MQNQNLYTTPQYNPKESYRAKQTSSKGKIGRVLVFTGLVLTLAAFSAGCIEENIFIRGPPDCKVIIVPGPAYHPIPQQHHKEHYHRR